jgi:tetratricopeptide (TPR) repeat protein
VTSFSRSSAPEAALVAALFAAAFCGCGPSDGREELAEGRAAYEVRNLEKAAKLFAESVACAPDSVDAVLYLARTKLDLGELAEAQKLAARARELSDDVDVRLFGAQVAFHAKDYAAAAKEFQAVADDARQTAELRAQAWSGVGVVEMACEHSHLARIAFLRALRLNFKDASARYHLGLLYRDGFSYYEAALEQLQVYSRLDEEASPRVQKVKRSMIPALQRQLSVEAATRPGASKRDSSAASAAIARAAAAEKAGKNDTARNEYAAALKADPLSAPAALGLAKCWSKTAPSKKKGGVADPQTRALDYYQLACALQPSKVATFLTAGKLAANLNQTARAVEIYSRAVAASPTSAEAIDGLIRALRRQGKSKTAQAYQGYRDFLASARR